MLLETRDSSWNKSSSGTRVALRSKYVGTYCVQPGLWSVWYLEAKLREKSAKLRDKTNVDKTNNPRKIK